MRTESDCLGEYTLPVGVLYGIHAARAGENFRLSGKPVHAALISACGTVKLACAMTNHSLGLWDDASGKAESIFRACREHVHAATATMTGLVGTLGYEHALDIARGASLAGLSPRAYALREGLFTEAAFEALVSPETVCRLGMPDPPRMKG